MIPFIIGGVALAATGYGVAKLLEDDCNCNKESGSFFVDLKSENYEAQEDEVIEKYELTKIELYNTSLMELKTALNEIENLDKEILITTLEFEKTIYPFEELTDDIKHSFEKYTDILQNTKEYINTKLDSLDSIIVNESDYEKYTNDDKKLVDDFMHLCTLIDKVSHAQMTNDKIDISRKVKRWFFKIEKMIS